MNVAPWICSRSTGLSKTVQRHGSGKSRAQGAEPLASTTHLTAKLRQSVTEAAGERFTQSSEQSPLSEAAVARFYRPGSHPYLHLYLISDLGVVNAEPSPLQLHGTGQPQGLPPPSRTNRLPPSSHRIRLPAPRRALPLPHYPLPLG